MQSVIALARDFRTLWVALGTVFVIVVWICSKLWPLASNQVQVMAGVPELLLRLESIDARMASIETRLPRHRVAEYDPMASAVTTPCVMGENCRVRFELWRTDWGQNCGAPELILAWIKQPGRAKRPVPLVNAQRVRVGTDILGLTQVFAVPSDAKAGIAHFGIDLEYPGCPDQDGPYPETTPILAFQIIKGK